MRSHLYPANDKPFSHICSHGIEFKADRCDFANGIHVYHYADMTQEQLASATAEMIGFHAVNIWPDFNGFSGYGHKKWFFHLKE